MKSAISNIAVVSILCRRTLGYEYEYEYELGAVKKVLRQN